jgi:phosphopantetheinyl transferase
LLIHVIQLFMPIFFQHQLSNATQLAIWKIEEPELFFAAKVPLQNSITHPHKRLQHLAGRYLLQHLAADFPYHEMLIATTRKPFLPNEQYHFSISHCANYAAAIVSNSERVGIDIELPTPRVLKIAPKFLHNSEQEWVALQHHSEVLLTTLLWNAKEAIYKWWGRGEVDFAAMIIIEPFMLQTSGSMVARFIKDEACVELQLQYHCFQEVCATWVKTDVLHLFT